MFTTNINLLDDIFRTIIENNNEIEISDVLKSELEKQTGLYNCSFYDEKLSFFEQEFNGEINITKCLNSEIDCIAERGGRTLKHEYIDGKKNNLGQECLKSYQKKFSFSGNEYTINIIQYFGQVRNESSKNYDPFKIVCIQIPNEIANL